MEPDQFAGQIQADPVARNLFPIGASGKALKNVWLHFWRNRRAVVSNPEINSAILFVGGDIDRAPAAIVLASVLEEVLQNKGSITAFAGDVESGRNVGLNLEAERIGKRVQIVEPFLDQGGQVHGI